MYSSASRLLHAGEACRICTMMNSYTVSLPSGMAKQVARYAESREASMSKAIASLVRLGLDHQEQRKRDFFQKLKANLADDNPERQDRVIDDFRALILGR